MTSAISIEEWVMYDGSMRWRVGFRSPLVSPSHADYQMVCSRVDNSSHPVRVWIRENISNDVQIYPVARAVVCLSEEDATLLYMAFR